MTTLITGDGTYSVIVNQDAGGNDIWFGSEESARKPQLIVETGSGETTSSGLSLNRYVPGQLPPEYDPVQSQPETTAAIYSEVESQPSTHATVQPSPELLRLRFQLLGPTELELGWGAAHEGNYLVQFRASLSEGEWTTVFVRNGASGTVRIPIGPHPAQRFFRLLRGE